MVTSQIVQKRKLSANGLVLKIYKQVMGNGYSGATDAQLIGTLLNSAEAEYFNMLLAELCEGNEFAAIELLSRTRSSVNMVCISKSSADVWVMRAVRRASILHAPLSMLKSYTDSGCANLSEAEQASEQAGLKSMPVTSASVLSGESPSVKRDYLAEFERWTMKNMARSSRMLSHPMLAPFVTPFSLILTSGSTFVLGYPWQGTSLRSYDRASHPTSEILLRWWTFQLLTALVQLHSCGVTHGNLDLDCVAIRDCGTTIRLTNVGSVSPTFETIPRQNAAVAYDLFFKHTSTPSPTAISHVAPSEASPSGEAPSEPVDFPEAPNNVFNEDDNPIFLPPEW